MIIDPSHQLGVLQSIVSDLRAAGLSAGLRDGKNRYVEARQGNRAVEFCFMSPGVVYVYYWPGGDCDDSGDHVKEAREWLYPKIPHGYTDGFRP